MFKCSTTIVIVMLLGRAATFAAPESAKWIAAEKEENSSNVVTHYRLAFPLNQKPDRFIVNVTADSIYRLFVNGIPVASGPTSGDSAKWRYDMIDIAPQLVKTHDQ